ncbi:hypothetical protein LPB72_10445 [Hydrogenophaga crassostreae]|uniref:Uncharacterized protein n=1 Tax=Hydrogenophaga crassostreae TaxID=1763535 RepID=A0A167HTQ2_9BURK|nr:hypothetical protein LPB072_11825 [Hydrogenophaga crassostreae]OAD41727.1 hypothetical protein LPB72_10445 [Hydrogenophaga crassostreae]
MRIVSDPKGKTSLSRLATGLRGTKKIGCNPRGTGLARYNPLRPGPPHWFVGITAQASAFAGFASMPSAAQAPGAVGEAGFVFKRSCECHIAVTRFLHS